MREYKNNYKCPNCGFEIFGEFGLVSCSGCDFILDDRDIITEQDLSTTFMEKHIAILI